MQGAIGGFDLRDFGGGLGGFGLFDFRRLDEAIGFGDVGRKLAAEQDTEEAAERVTNTRQILLLRNYQDTTLGRGGA